MDLETLRLRLRAAGAGPTHERRILRLWSNALPMDSGKRRIEDFLPAGLRAELPAIEAELQGLARIASVHPGADGSERLLVALRDGQTVESVLLPREGLCISSQVGCAVGCRFCMTGRGGLERQLGSAEMVAQVATARARRPVKKVVFMGMGEPAHNLDAVLDAIALLGTAGGIGHKNLVFSTVGDPRVFERLPREHVKPALALSLHTTKPELREALLPRAPRMTPQALVEAADAYGRASGYPIQYQWTLLEGVNDGEDEIEGIVRLLSGRYGVLNMIPFNKVDGLDFRRPSWERAAGIARTLHQRGILTKLRQSAAQDVEGGCGQLRARSVIRMSVAPAAASTDRQALVAPPRMPAGTAGSAGMDGGGDAAPEGGDW
ncbi:RNA methyltransferase [Ramlibacter monticola]|uniref:RNA methyltransferase n=1 Tax=Ramlibacter monticola TaxID=1926872 RepID=A0A937CRZ6_9BURK|nr:RNA methyltransferase [Ramlibacter monticola]MBL0391185.1 RNA methyltransferase [Ramlibacter monticola]